MGAVGTCLKTETGHLMNDRRDQRIAERHFVVCCGTVYVGTEKHVGLIRDLSRYGIFVYSDFTPSLGETLQVVFTGQGREGASISCTGTVVRVETRAAGAAVGIALQVTAYRL